MADIQYTQMNQAFAEKTVASLLEKIRTRIEKERSADGFSFEAYYSIENPYAGGSAEKAYFDELLGTDTAKDPRYMDLFERMMRLLRDGLKNEGVKHFATLNCRFDLAKEDNFLLYVFVS